MAIYKYVTAERIDIFKNGHIRFTQPSVFNDPFETFPYFFAIAPEDAVDDFLKKQPKEKFEQSLSEAWTKECQKYGINIPLSMVRGLMPKAEDVQPIIHNWLKQFMTMKQPDFRNLATHTILEGINKAFGMLCLTEKPDNLLMWAHYSRNHTGFVIEFDEKHDFFDPKTSDKQIANKLMKVRYAKKRPEITLFDPAVSSEQNLEHWANDLFLVKSEHWEYEQEWRMIRSLKECTKIMNGSEEIYLYPIPLECITGIIWGCRILESARDFLYLRVRGNKEFSHVRLWQASINEKEYKLDFKEIS